MPELTCDCGRAEVLLAGRTTTRGAAGLWASGY